MKSTILNQGPDGRCKNCSFLTAMEILGMIENPQEVLDSMTENFLTNNRAANELKVSIKPIQHWRIKIFAKRGIPVICSFNGIDWDDTKKEPFEIKFEDRVGAHSVCIIGYEYGRFIIQNSHGENPNSGILYLKEEDLRRIKSPCIITGKYES